MINSLDEKNPGQNYNSKDSIDEIASVTEHVNYNNQNMKHVNNADIESVQSDTKLIH